MHIYIRVRVAGSVENQSGNAFIIINIAQLYKRSKQITKMQYLPTFMVRTVSMLDRVPSSKPRPLLHFTLEPLRHRLAALMMANALISVATVCT